MPIDEAAALDKAIKKVEIRIGRKVTLTEAIRQAAMAVDGWTMQM